MPPNNPFPRDVFVGEFQREFSLAADDQWLLDVPGGNALYASAGYLVWEDEETPGILTRVGEDFPQAWLEDFSNQGINIDGVVVLPEAVDLRACYIHKGHETRQLMDPIPHFSRLGIALPPALIGYTSQHHFSTDRRIKKDTSIRESDIPQNFLYSSLLYHICKVYLIYNKPLHNLF